MFGSNTHRAKHERWTRRVETVKGFFATFNSGRAVVQDHEVAREEHTNRSSSSRVRHVNVGGGRLDREVIAGNPAPSTLPGSAFSCRYIRQTTTIFIRVTRILYLNARRTKYDFASDTWARCAIVTRAYPPVHRVLIPTRVLQSRGRYRLSIDTVLSFRRRARTFRARLVYNRTTNDRRIWEREGDDEMDDPWPACCGRRYAAPEHERYASCLCGDGYFFSLAQTDNNRVYYNARAYPPAHHVLPPSRVLQNRARHRLSIDTVPSCCRFGATCAYEYRFKVVRRTTVGFGNARETTRWRTRVIINLTGTKISETYTCVVRRPSGPLWPCRAAVERTVSVVRPFRKHDVHFATFSPVSYYYYKIIIIVYKTVVRDVCDVYVTLYRTWQNVILYYEHLHCTHTHIFIYIYSIRGRGEGRTLGEITEDGDT